ncbi:MAG: radical SAM protein, partial [Deltaproteobacteria bacterium]|nr:radical SAM protein [Deltaproteobacteria bacterium]
DIPRRAYINALLSRGDRKVARILLAAHGYHGNWPQTFKASSLDADFYVRRQHATDEVFPWDFIDCGVKKSFLQKEYIRALQEKS